jgi:hypothetical protein
MQCAMTCLLQIRGSTRRRMFDCFLATLVLCFVLSVRTSAAQSNPDNYRRPNRRGDGIESISGVVANDKIVPHHGIINVSSQAAKVRTESVPYPSELGLFLTWHRLVIVRQFEYVALNMLLHHSYSRLSSRMLHRQNVH